MELVYTGTPKGYYPNFISQEDDLIKQGLIPEKDYAKQIASKAATFPSENRAILVDVLRSQYANIPNANASAQIEGLLNEHTFTVTTGQQIHIFLGPMYVHNKIVSTIALVNKLKSEFPQKSFVPIFWMATEDHDMEEIEYIDLFGKRIKWSHGHQGISGTAPTSGLVELMNKALEGKNGINEEYRELFTQAYSTYKTLADATRFLVDAIYGKEGVVVMDANEPKLKALFKESIKKDLIEDSYSKGINTSTEAIKDFQIKPIISARRSHFFYISASSERLRIDVDDSSYHTAGNEKTWTKEALSVEIDTHPERFSPNVALRPLYQETLLPNLAYLAGPSEYVYWLQIQRTFSEQIPSPILALRNSYIYIPEKAWNKITKIEGLIDYLFQNEKDFEEGLTHLMLGDDPIKSVLEKQRKLLFDDLALLKSKNTPNLKGIHTLSTEYLKALEGIQKEFSENRLDQSDLINQRKGLTTVNQLYFNLIDKWERKTFYFQQIMLINPFNANKTKVYGKDRLSIYCG